MNAAADTTASRRSEGRFLKRLLFTSVGDLLRGRLRPHRGVTELIREAELPRALEVLVICAVNHTRLWPSEQADIAEELIGHFADGLASGGDAEDLAQQFGDPRQAGRLIRRAKKRQRPWWWRTSRRVMQSVLLVLLACVATYLVLAARYFLASPTITHNYLVEVNAEALAASEDDRAWPLYREALLALSSWPHEETDPHPRPGDERWGEYVAWLESNAGALEAARQAARKPVLGYVAAHRIHEADRELWPESYASSHQVSAKASADDLLADSLISVALPYLAELRKLAMIMIDDARRLIREHDDGSAAVDELLTVSRLAEHVTEPRTIIGDLVSMSCFAASLDAAGEFLHDDPKSLTDDDLLRLAHGLAAFSDGNLSVRLDSERLMFKDLLQRLYTDDGNGDGYMTGRGMRAFASLVELSTTNPVPGNDWLVDAAGPLLSAAMAGRQEMLAKYDELLNAAIIEGEQPLWKRTGQGVEATVETMRGNPIDNVRYLPITLMMPALSKASIQGELVTQQRDGVLVAIALELHRRRHGSWPASLEALTPRLLPTVPLDRFSGEPIGYVVFEGQARLYSVGTDRIDQGGEPVRRADGRPDADVARRWVSPERIRAIREAEARAAAADRRHASPLPEGDWILWPPMD